MPEKQKVGCLGRRREHRRLRRRQRALRRAEAQANRSRYNPGKFEAPAAAEARKS